MFAGGSGVGLAGDCVGQGVVGVSAVDLFLGVVGVLA